MQVMKRRNKLVSGHGINDYPGMAVGTKFYAVWHNILNRCYEDHLMDCVMSKAWLSLSNFKRWFDSHYIAGYYLNKTLLNREDKEYSPSTCCYLPPEINQFLANKVHRRDGLPNGVNAQSKTTYAATITIERKLIYLGTFYSVDDAFSAYKSAREKRARELAEKYKGKIEDRAYQALINYEEKR